MVANIVQSFTSLIRADEVVPRSSGSIARRDPIKGNEEGGKTANASEMRRL
jgi:hypothetical protein